MKRYKSKFNKDRHPRMYECPPEISEMFETQSREDVCEALARLLDETLALKISYSAACAAAEISIKNVEKKDLELATLTETLEEREEELRKLTGVSLIKCQCQIETETLN